MLNNRFVLVAGGLLVAAAGFTMASERQLDGTSAQAASDGRVPVVERVVDSAAGLAGGWMDFGYSPHTIRTGSLVEVDFANYGGLILTHAGPLEPAGGSRSGIMPRTSLATSSRCSFSLHRGRRSPTCPWTVVPPGSNRTVSSRSFSR